MNDKQKRRPQAPTGRPHPTQPKCAPSEPKKAVPDGFVDPAAGIVFPQRRRRLR